MEAISHAALAIRLGYLDNVGNPSPRAIAQLMREALNRWGLCPRRALFKHVRDQLRACGVPTDTVPHVFSRLVALGECAQLFVSNEPYVAPAERRWISSDPGLATLLGMPVVPTSSLKLLHATPQDMLLRACVDDERFVNELASNGVREASLSEWMEPFGYLHHLERHTGKPVRNDEASLSTFWHRLDALVGEFGGLVGSDVKLRAAVGAAGGYFGRHSAEALEGRWSESPPDGTWCGYRKGYGDNHWHPILISIDGSERRAIDLFDDDEWRWALLARSFAVGPREICRTEGEELQVTWPLPAQIHAALDIAAPPTGRWRWRITSAVSSVWDSLI